MNFPIDNSTFIYILAGLGVILLVLIIWMIRLQTRLSRLLAGKNAKSLEDSFVAISHELKDLHAFTKEMESYLLTVEKRLKRSVQSIDTIRFNPFKGTGSGGNQSFSSVFVNERGDGVILTSMYTRDRISMFAKPLKAFTSEFELSDEEKEALAKSKTTLTK
jgi:hypothetical protein